MIIQLVLNANHNTSKAVVVDDAATVTPKSLTKYAINKFSSTHGLRRKTLRMFLPDGTEIESDTTLPEGVDHLTIFISKGESFAGPGSFDLNTSSSSDTTHTSEEESEELYSIIEQVMLFSIVDLYGKQYKRLLNVAELDGIRAVVLIENPENRIPQQDILAFLKGNENDISEEDLAEAIWPSNGKWRPKNGIKAVIVGSKQSVRVARRVLRGQGMPRRRDESDLCERIALIQRNDAFYFDAQSFWWCNTFDLENVAVVRNENELGEFIRDRGSNLKLNFPCVYVCGEETQMEQMFESWKSEFDLWFKLLRL